MLTRIYTRTLTLTLTLTHPNPTQVELALFCTLIMALYHSRRRVQRHAGPCKRKHPTLAMAPFLATARANERAAFWRLLGGNATSPHFRPRHCYRPSTCYGHTVTLSLSLPSC